MEQADHEQSLVDHKCYIQHESEIHQHKLWRLDGFWEDALLQGVQAQMDMMEAVLWDELEPDHLKEKVIGENYCEFNNNALMCFGSITQCDIRPARHHGLYYARNGSFSARGD